MSKAVSSPKETFSPSEDLEYEHVETLKTPEDTFKTIRDLLSECAIQFKLIPPGTFRNPEEMLHRDKAGVMVYHPLKQDDSGNWYTAPHFHMVGFHSPDK